MSLCSQNENLIAFLDEELAADERTRFESHLSGCESCRAALELQRGLGESLAALPQIAPSAGFESRFWSRVTQEDATKGGFFARIRERLGWRTLATGVGTAAVAALALTLALRAPSPETDPDWAIVADGEKYELLEDTDIELLDAMEFLEVWEGEEI